MEAKGKKYIIHPSRSDEFTIWNIADIHYGNRGCALDKVKADIETIRTDDHAFWIGGGDYCEYIGFTDRRFDPEAVAESISVADMGKLGRKLAKFVRDLFAPIKDKCLGLLLGNHEKHYERAKEQTDLHGWLCTELGAPNLGYCALFDAVFVRNPKSKAICIAPKSPARGYTRESFRVFAHHGTGYATTPAGKLNKLIQFMYAFDADIYMIAHVHDQEGRRSVQLGADAACTNIVERQRLGIITGSYLKTYADGVTTYGEQRGYAPTTLGASFVWIKPETREFKGEI